MTFYEVLEQVITLLQRHGRVSYRALTRQFALDHAYIDDLKAELIEMQQVAVDQNGAVLVWTGRAAPCADTVAPRAAPAAPAMVGVQEPPPLAYTPAHLTDKILSSRVALTGERKQVTVLFADIKDSTELIRGLDPEAAQHLLDPALQHMMAAVSRMLPGMANCSMRAARCVVSPTAE